MCGTRFNELLFHYRLDERVELLHRGVALLIGRPRAPHGQEGLGPAQPPLVLCDGPEEILAHLLLAGELDQKLVNGELEGK